MATAEPRAGGALQRVLRLKERLSSAAQDIRKIAKALEELQDTKISLEILVETGIGKTVNSFRKHADVGDVAKSLVSQWKMLVPQEMQSDSKEQLYDKNDLRSSIPKPSKLSDGKIKVSESAEREPRNSSHSEDSKPRNGVKVKETAKEIEGKRRHHGEKAKTNDPKKNEETAFDVPSNSCNGRQSVSERFSSKSSTAKKGQLGHNRGMKQLVNEFSTLKNSGSHVERSNQNDSPKVNVKLTGEDFEPPTMSFESYLNYDQISMKRKKKNNAVTENSKKLKTVLPKLPDNENIKKEQIKCKPDPVPETQVKKVKVQSLKNLLDVPLPKFLPHYAILPSPTYEADKGAAPEAISQENSDQNCFTGKRLNSKMQVYSGSKPIFLTKMLTLYEQCLRVLQNNIDLLYEVGGVPFEILEPVLERCTPEQLYRIEEYNQTFIEDSDHLWKKHCQKDFRNENLLEYESWREMYLRLFSEREEKLQKITKDISSAHSGKPKGRQVKLAYVHSAAKPPRSIRRKQEIFGTAGPIAQSHPIDRMKMQKLERERTNRSSSPKASTSTASVVSSPPTNRPSQDNRRPLAPPIKRIAPMMAKSMRAFKNRVGPR